MTFLLLIAVSNPPPSSAFNIVIDYLKQWLPIPFQWDVRNNFIEIQEYLLISLQILWCKAKSDMPPFKVKSLFFSYTLLISIHPACSPVTHFFTEKCFSLLFYSPQVTFIYHLSIFKSHILHLPRDSAYRLLIHPFW